MNPESADVQKCKHGDKTHLLAGALTFCGDKAPNEPDGAGPGPKQNEVVPVSHHLMDPKAGEEMIQATNAQAIIELTCMEGAPGKQTNIHEQ